MTACARIAPTSTGRVARDVCRRLDRALKAGRITAARRLVRPATRTVRRRPRLAERLAQRALAVGEPGIALAVADACRKPTESLRALRRVCLAELDVPETGARGDRHASGLRLAARQLRSSAPCSAARTLRHLIAERDDLDALLLLVLLSHARTAPAASRQWLARARTAAEGEGGAAVVSTLAKSLGLPDAVASGRPSEAEAKALAGELERDGRAVQTLTEAAARTGDRASATLLAAAVAHALPRLAAPGSAATAIARMLLRLGDAASARAWAERVLETDRLSVASARLLHECNEALYQLERRHGGDREAA